VCALARSEQVAALAIRACYAGLEELGQGFRPRGQTDASISKRSAKSLVCYWRAYFNVADADGGIGVATQTGVAGIVGIGKGDDVIDHRLRALAIPTARAALSVAHQQIRPHDISLHFMETFEDRSLSPHVAHSVDADTPRVHKPRTVLDCECLLESYAFCPEREKEIPKSSMRRVICSARTADA